MARLVSWFDQWCGIGSMMGTLDTWWSIQLNAGVTLFKAVSRHNLHYGRSCHAMRKGCVARKTDVLVIAFQYEGYVDGIGGIVRERLGETNERTNNCRCREFCMSLNANCTINTSDTELMLRTYMVTPTSTGGPAINKTIRPWSLWLPANL